MDRLEPFEKLDSDYYLGDHAGWYSDGEHQDSDSSNDELSEEISKLAGVRRCQQKPKQGDKRDRRESRMKDEFESDMDDELDERLVAHASEFMQANASTSKPSTSTVSKPNVVVEGTNVILKKEPDQEEGTTEMELLDLRASPEESREGERDSTSAGASELPKKSVSFKEEPQVFGICETSDEKTKSTEKGKTAFDDANNLLRRMADKAMKGEEEEMEFYDANEDDGNEQWVREHRRRLGLFNDERKGQKADASFVAQEEKNDDTDAVLSCPACMTLLTRQCQRHQLYRNQYRAMFVENCKIVVEETVFMPESGKKKRKDMKKCEAARPKPNTVVSASEASTLRREDLFHPVQCAVCSTAVGVYDVDEVYHFFNVLTGYA
uniref:E2F-associated phosphoprotein n=1 Tax=Ascaris lumbricoides TaxID=6252 RepID=A0A0M3I0Y2_ASCLU